MRRIMKLALAGATCGALAFGGMSLAQPQQDGSPPPRRPDGPPQGNPMPGPMRGPVLRVAGNAQVQAAPDHATVRLGAVAQAGEADAAQDQVNQIMRRALDAIRGLGVAEQDVRTADLSLYPVYDQRPPQPGQREAQEPRIVGYRASNTIVVDLSDLTKIGQVVDASVKAGANQLQGIEFSLRDDQEARSRALEQAVNEARRKAETLARAAGMQLGQLVELNEGGVSVIPPQPMYAMGRMAMAEAAPTPVQPGQLDIHASVNLVYHLRPANGGAGGDPPATRPVGE